MVPVCHGIIEPWYNGSMVPLHHGTIAPNDVRMSATVGRYRASVFKTISALSIGGGPASPKPIDADQWGLSDNLRDTHHPPVQCISLTALGRATSVMRDLITAHGCPCVLHGMATKPTREWTVTKPWTVPRSSSQVGGQLGDKPSCRPHARNAGEDFSSCTRGLRRRPKAMRTTTDPVQAPLSTTIRSQGPFQAGGQAPPSTAATNSAAGRFLRHPEPSPWMPQNHNVTYNSW